MTDTARVPRVPLVVRVKPASLAAIERLAAVDGVTRAEWVRTALAAAVTARRDVFTSPHGAERPTT